MAEKSARRSAGEIDSVTACLLASRWPCARRSMPGPARTSESSRAAVAMVSKAIAAANESVVAVGHGLDEIAGATEQQRPPAPRQAAGIEAIAGMARENNAAVR